MLIKVYNSMYEEKFIYFIFAVLVHTIVNFGKRVGAARR